MYDLVSILENGITHFKHIQKETRSVELVKSTEVKKILKLQLTYVNLQQ